MKEDLRIKKTKLAIKQAFIKLVKEKGYKNVMIKDIADEAMINRNTFYLHYFSKEDLVLKIMDDVANEQHIKMARDIILESHLRPNLEQIANTFLTICYNEIEFYKIILTDDAMKAFTTKLKNDFKDACLISLKIYNKKLNDLDFELLTGGIFSLLEKWIINEMATIPEMANAIIKFIEKNIINA